MPDLSTEADARAYLREAFPSREFDLYAFNGGWVCTPAISQDEQNAVPRLGQPQVVLDSKTAVVYQYPSWSAPMTAEAHAEFQRTGENTAANQIYPHRWKISLRKSDETDANVEYHMTIQSLTSSGETDQHPLTLEKSSYLFSPTDSMSALASAHVRWAYDQNGQIWPETDETTH